MSGLTPTVKTWYLLGHPLVDTKGLLNDIQERPWMMVERKGSWVAIREDKDLRFE